MDMTTITTGSSHAAGKRATEIKDPLRPRPNEGLWPRCNTHLVIITPSNYHPRGLTMFDSTLRLPADGSGCTGVEYIRSFKEDVVEKQSTSNVAAAGLPVGLLAILACTAYVTSVWLSTTTPAFCVRAVLCASVGDSVATPWPRSTSIE